jgi:RNA polymerase sigma-70 factor (ECF subfamily)
LADQEQSCRVRRALFDLPQEQSQVIAMHLFGEITFKQIARSLGQSPNTIQSRYRYGLEKLGAILKTEDVP